MRIEKFDQRPRDLLEMIQRAASRPDRGLRFFRGGEEVEFVSYGQLYEDAGRIAGALLADAGVRPSERVAVVLPTSADCVRALWGVLAAGAVPVPLPPPLPFSKPLRYAERIRGAVQRSGIRLIIGDEMVDPFLREMGVELEGQVTILSSPQLRGTGPVHRTLDPDAAALVQYTSGSTSAPKGVVLSHRQVLANLEAIAFGLGVKDDDKGCSWLPLFHDMGLIGCLYTSIYRGIELLLMPPEDFVIDPANWLRLFGRHRATIAPAPNAAYLHCVKRVSVKTAAGMDLSSWRTAMNGSEGVEPETMRRFAAHFSGAGFRPEAFMAVYGMAEATLAVSFSPQGQGVFTLRVRRSALSEGRVEVVGEEEGDSKELASVGTPVLDLEISLRTGSGTEVAAGIIGEIHIRGASIMGRYDQDEAATRAAFREGWLATGDLGFVQDGRLYITGRRKEIIIVRGQNYYASDIENLAGQVKGVAMQGVMALSVASEGTEALVLLIENRQSHPDAQRRIKQEVREAISSTLGISPDDIALVGRGGLPRTSSGKLERYKGPHIYKRYRDQQASSVAGEVEA
ncbi:MAG: hypothetical protein NVSMB62_21570 [Acidobacteriaceae bacterium]